MSKSFVLTKHAKQVTKERGVREDWIERVIYSPQRIEKDKGDASLSHYLGIMTERSDRVLRVVLNCTVSPMRVVTAYFDRKLRNKL